MFWSMYPHPDTVTFIDMLNFVRLCRLQNKKASQGIGWKIASTLMVLISVLSFGIEAWIQFGSERTSVLSAARMWSVATWNCESTFRYLYDIFLMFGLPLLPVLIFSDEIVASKKNHTAQLIFTRVSQKKYYASVLSVSFWKSTSLVFVTMLLNQLLWMICCPLQSDQPLTTLVSTEFEATYLFLFPNLFFNHPYLYNLLYMVLIAFLAGVFAIFSVALSFICKRQMSVYIIPELVYLAEIFLAGAIGKNCFSIIETILPCPEVFNLTMNTYLIFVAILLCISAILIVYGIFLQKDEFS